MARVSDYQQDAVYEWQKSVWDALDWNTHLRSKEYLERLIEDVRQHYGEYINMNAVDLSVEGDLKQDEDEAAALAHGSYLIEVRPECMYDQIILHEMAHVIFANVRPGSYERRNIKAFVDHGSVFVGLYMYLLKWHYELETTSISVMCELARKHEIDFLNWQTCKPVQMEKLSHLRNNRWLGRIING